jgi:hypothetical protein
MGFRASLWPALVVLLLTASCASALAACATEAYTRSCDGCSFTGDSMDQGCKDSYQNKGKLCVMAAYPIASTKYFADMCPPMQGCIDILQSCNGARCAGDDQSRCRQASCRSCYEDADRCAYLASYNCDDTEKCGNKDCNADKGENQETCCADCGCAGGKKCVDDRCEDTNLESSGLDGDIVPFVMCLPFLLGPLAALLAAIAVMPPF